MRYGIVLRRTFKSNFTFPCGKQVLNEVTCTNLYYKNYLQEEETNSSDFSVTITYFAKSPNTPLSKNRGVIIFYIRR